MRLERAFLSGDELLASNGERLLHSYSRLGVWAEELAKAIAREEVSRAEVAEQLRKLAEFGRFAFHEWSRRH
jgi:hypothetical protein